MDMSIGLAFRCFFAALSGDDRSTRLHRALEGIKDPPVIKEVIREVAVPHREAPPPREIIKEVEVVREVIKEVPVEVIKEVVREVRVPFEVIKEVPVEVIKEVEVIREVPVEVVREVEVVKEVVREVPREVIKETIREVPKETIREVVKLVPDTHGPVQVLALLQQDGRLIDFLNEEIDSFDDDQIGAAVREIHSKCRKSLQKHINVVPVRAEKEGEVISIGAGYDPSAIRVTGKVSDKVPMFGTLRHRGWKASKVELPTRPSGADPAIIMPAEVEVE
jgi:hypothetical protein